MVQQSYWMQGRGSPGQQRFGPWGMPIPSQQEGGPAEAPPNVFGSSGIYAGMDKYLPGMDENGNPRWESLTTNAPLRFAAMERELDPQIRKMFQGALLEGTETLATQRRQGDRVAGDRAASMGLAPSMYATRMAPEQNMAYANQVATMRGQAMTGEAGMRASVTSGIVNALNQVEAYYDQLRLQNYLAKQAMRRDDEAGKMGMLGSLGNMALSGFGMAGMAGMGPFKGMMGAAGGGAIGSSAGSLF